MKILIVNNKFNNKKLLDFLKQEFPSTSDNTFYKALRKKNIRINDVKVSENAIVHEGDEIKLYISDTHLEQKLELKVVYEDENILIINKPKEIEVTGDNSLTSFVQAYFSNEQISPCHRLDRNTNGLVIFAKNSSALEILLRKFKNHEITKIYKCRIFGIMRNKHETLKAYLFKDTKKSMVYISGNKEKGYREIITEYRVLEEDSKNNTSILEIILHTGRTHQIRAHLAYIGYPIIGDRKIW